MSCDEDMDEQLYVAAASGDLSAECMTPLHVSSDKGHLQVVTELIARGAVVHINDQFYCTPLHFAAQGGHADVAKELLAHGAAVDALCVVKKVLNNSIHTAFLRKAEVASVVVN
ncbi:unnamed protein product [Aphanomyces euteiches]